MCAHRGDVAWVYREAKSWASRVSVFGMTMKIAAFWQLGVDEKKGLSFHLHAVNKNADEIERQARSLQVKYTIPQEVRRVHIILAAIKLCKTTELKSDLYRLIVSMAKKNVNFTSEQFIKAVYTAEWTREELCMVEKSLLTSSNHVGDHTPNAHVFSTNPRGSGKGGKGNEGGTSTNARGRGGKGNEGGRRFCFRFQTGTCKFNPCRFVHEKDPSFSASNNGTTANKSKPVCTYCEKTGHQESNCWVRKKVDGGNGQANMAQMIDNDELEKLLE